MMNALQQIEVRDSQRTGLYGVQAERVTQARPDRRVASRVHEKHTRNKARVTAAILYLVATCFLGAILSVVATSWGKDGYNLVLTKGNLAQPAVIYMLVAGGFFLATSNLLFSPLSLPTPIRIAVLACAVVLMLAGLIYAAPVAILSLVPFWYFLRFHQEVTPPVVPYTNVRQQGLSAASAI
ncbi:MAG: hypothetical protein GZ085_12290 [Sulfuriferula multivorans]|uniref:Uncharacterized protein n=1 Tax=Sulfuriferula multivorans TaxID=1559896 RepID=A0A7C9TAG9_9PROT|nr:hypothetical protein [Sulfuriferula multivorans]